ncbi:hypothetical protein ACFODQ_00480 [Comamonas sp. JC664]
MRYGFAGCAGTALPMRSRQAWSLRPSSSSCSSGLPDSAALQAPEGEWAVPGAVFGHDSANQLFSRRWHGPWIRDRPAAVVVTS